MSQAVRISLRVSAGAKSPAVVGPYLEGWKIRVAAAPEGGKANDESCACSQMSCRSPRSG